MQRRSKTRRVLFAMLALLPTAVLGAPPAQYADFTPGHPIVRISVEDNRDIGLLGVEIGWATFWNDDLLVTPSTGLRLRTHHETGAYVGSWTAALRVSGTTPVTPFLEFGIDIGEGVAEALGDWLVEDRPSEAWVEMDMYSSAGFEFDLGPQWRGNIYYRAHSLHGGQLELDHSGVVGVALVHRFKRARLLWWQIPL